MTVPNETYCMIRRVQYAHSCLHTVKVNHITANFPFFTSQSWITAFLFSFFNPLRSSSDPSHLTAVFCLSVGPFLQLDA